MDDITKKWKEARAAIEAPPNSVAALITSARKKNQSVLFFHYGNIIILTMVLIMISAFFFYRTPFRDVLSKTGVAMMVLGLFLRIIIEGFSAIKYSRIHFTHDALAATSETVSFYKFRKTIHGPVTIAIVAAYIAGFYFLTPEFSRYISLIWMIIMDVLFIPGAIILAWQIRKGIHKEMQTLTALIALQGQLNSTERSEL
jgi:hypothetical protein